MVTKEQVLEKLKEVKDPEIGVDVVSLGLVYEVLAGSDNRVKLTMTMTSPMCPLGDVIINEAKEKVKELPGVAEVEVEMTFDPPWDTSRMSSDAKAELGIL